MPSNRILINPTIKNIDAVETIQYTVGDSKMDELIEWLNKNGYLEIEAIQYLVAPKE